MLETASFWFNIATVILGLFAAAAAVFALYFSTRLNAIKDENLERFKRESNERIAFANSESAQANERAAEANKQAADANERAAEANKKAEEEKLARVKIEKQLAPRTLKESDIDEISINLRAFASNFSGRKVIISSYIIDAEGNVFALLINDILFLAGIETDVQIGRAMPIGLVDIGVKITAPTKDGDFVFKLSDEIFARLKTKLLVETNDKYKEVSILVGVKPVAGLPILIPKPGNQPKP